MKSAAKTKRSNKIYLAGNELWVSFKSSVLLEDVDVLKTSISPAIVRGIEHVYIDLQSMDFIDSAGLGLLIALKMTAKMQGAEISLVDPNSTVKDVLTVSQIAGIFSVVSDTDAAAKRKSIAQQKNLLTATSSVPLQNPRSEPVPDGEHFPQVTSEGAFQDIKSEAARVQDLVEEQCRHAVEAMRQGDYETSIVAYKSALSLDPDYLPALNNLAIVYEKQPAWRDLAVEAWTRVLELSRARKDDKHLNRAERHLTDLAD